MHNSSPMEESKRVRLLTIPFNQLANTDILARSAQWLCSFYGNSEKDLKWLVYGDEAEWPQEYEDVLRNNGISMETLPEDSLPNYSEIYKWPVGLCIRK